MHKSQIVGLFILISSFLWSLSYGQEQSNCPVNPCSVCKKIPGGQRLYKLKDEDISKYNKGACHVWTDKYQLIAGCTDEDKCDDSKRIYRSLSGSCITGFHVDYGDDDFDDTYAKAQEKCIKAFHDYLYKKGCKPTNDSATCENGKKMSVGAGGRPPSGTSFEIDKMKFRCSAKSDTCTEAIENPGGNSYCPAPSKLIDSGTPGIWGPEITVDSFCIWNSSAGSTSEPSSAK